MRDRDRDVRARHHQARAPRAEAAVREDRRRGVGRGLGASLAGVVATLAITALAACSDKPVDYAGIGKWRVGETTLADAKEGRCQPEKLTDGRAATWCFGNHGFKIGGSTVDIDLYFLGVAKDAPLIEIQLHVHACDDDQVRTWLRTNFGGELGPAKPHRGYWQNPNVWIGAQLGGASDGMCVIHMLPLSEQSEIARISRE